MNEAHTQGRVTFKEDGDANHYSMLTEDGRWWLAVLANGEQTSERQIANFRRLAACWNWCLEIPIDKLESKSIAEYVTEQAFLTGMAPSDEGFGIGLNGMACQMLGASFAGQFVGSGAVNFLEVNMSHPEIGPFTVTIQRHQGKTPGQMKAEVEQQLAAERASLFAESQRKQQLEQQVADLKGALKFMLERIPEPPDADCSCHISPPCNDCVDYAGEREAFQFAKDTIAAVEGGAG